MRYMEAIKKGLGDLIEVALLLVALGIVVQILFGAGPTAAVPFFGTIVPNLTGLISSVGDNGLAGLIALAVIIFLYRKRTTA
jgi:hypothetical protein